MNTVLSVFGGVVSFGMHLGIVRLFWVAVLAFVGILVFKMLDKVQSTVDWCGRHWRKAPTWRKQVYGFFGFVAVWKVLWPILPKTTAALAVALCVGVIFYAQGYQYARKYGLVGTHAMAAWRHHWRVTRAAKQLTKAHEDASAKKGGRARKPTPTSTGISYPMEPGNGESAEELAEDINAGRHKAATARRLGWDEVKSQKATVMPDGTVQVTIDSTTEDGSDSLNESHWWDGK